MCTKKDKYRIDHYELNRLERANLLQDLELKHGMFINALENFKGNGNQDIPLAELRKFVLMEWVYLNDKVKFRRRADLGDFLMFDCIMEKGGEFGMHFHSDCDEYIDVVSGKLFDIQANKTSIAGDFLKYEKKTKHIPVAMEDTILRVFFK